MKINDYFILFCVFCETAIAIGCNDSHTSQKRTVGKHKMKAMVVGKDTLNLPLDSTASSRFFSYNTQRINGQDYIIFSDLVSHSLLIYNIEKSELVKKISLPEDGPNGFGKDQKFCFLKNFDTIFISSQYNLFVIDSSGLIKRKYNLLSNDRKIGVQVRLSGFMPLVVLNSFAYFSVLPDLAPTDLSHLENWPVLGKLNLNSGEISFVYNLPEIYSKGIYGGNYLYPYFCFNRNTGNFIFSFAAENNLYETDLKSTDKSIPANSIHLDKRIEPAKPDEVETSEDRTRFALLTDSYGPIYYDPYRNLYLRIAQKKLDAQSFQSKKWSKTSFIMLLDEELQIIGESQIDNLNLYSLFFTPEGVYAQLKTSTSEDYVSFQKLEYSK